MRVVIAPDSFGGTLSPVEAAAAMAAGWRDARPDDEVVLRPMSDGGEGLLDAVAAAIEADGGDVAVEHLEVVGPRGLPVEARWLRLADGEAVVESAEACGLHLLEPSQRDPRRTTTWGVGQLLAAVATSGVGRVRVGLGGSATVDGGAGCLSGLGWRVTVGDGSGLKVGGEDLARVAGIAPGWLEPEVGGLAIDLLADVTTPLTDAAMAFGPQKGADAATVDHLDRGLQAWADVVEGTFGRSGLRHRPHTGAAGGLGFALVGAHDAALRPGAAAVAELVGLQDVLEGADLVLTGEGRLDATSLSGKVVGVVATMAESAGAACLAVCGQVAAGFDVRGGSAALEQVVAAPATGADDAADRLREAVRGVAAAR